jgi:ADP-heptose:LPS heptosyltransferase
MNAGAGGASAMSERVLLVRLSSLGDIVHTLPAAAGLAAARPDLDLAWVVQREWAPLLHGLPFLRHVIPFDRAGGLAALLRARRELRALTPSVALDLQGNWKSALVAFSSGARTRIGPRSRREPASSLLMTRRAAAPPGPHSTDRALSVVRALAPGATAQPIRLLPAAGEEEREAAALAAAGVDPTRPLLVLVAGRPGDPRTWPLEHLVALATQTDAQPLLLLGPAEGPLPADVRIAHLRHGTGEVRRLIALGSLVRRTRSLAVGPDGGAVHVLAACGARVLMLFGPQDERRTGPVSGRTLRLDPPPPCAPCVARVCAHPDGPVCMERLAPETVARALHEVGSGASDAGPT